MKQGTWSSLKNQICPQSMWVKDQIQKKCYCCNKQFLFLFRRRHHCRVCGKIFCSSCSDYFINGNYIDPTFEKYLRLCQFCHKKIKEYITDMDKKNFFGQKKNSTQYQSSSKINSDSQDQIEDQDIIVPLFQDQLDYNGKQFSDRLNNEIKKKVQQLATFLCQLKNIPQKWVQTLSKIAIKAISDTKIDTVYNNNLLKITNYIKIKKVLTNQPNATKYIKGFIATKNVSNKHMQTFFSNPKIMIVSKSIDLNSFCQQELKFEDIMSKQKQALRKILDKLLKFNPDVIFVQQIVNINALEYLQMNNVTVIVKMKPEAIQKIKKLTRIKKKVQKIWKIAKCKRDQIVGTCQKLYFKKYETQQKSKTIMFMQDDVGMTSILLADTDHQTLVQLKIIMRSILKIARHLYLEKYLLDIQSFKLNKGRVTGLGFFDSFINQKFLSIDKFFYFKRLNFTKVNYVNSRFYKFPDIQKPEIIENYLKLNNFQYNWKIKDQSQLCVQPYYKDMKFYSRDDIALGTYIVLKAANIDKKCNKCNRPKYNHHSIYYYDNALIKILVQTKVSINRSKISMIGETIDKDQSYLVTKQNLYKFIKDKQKGSQNSRQIIQSYIQCQQCNMKLSQQVELKRNYLEFSFLYFLLKIFKSVNDKESNSNQQIEKKRCMHTKRSRVFKYDDAYVKFIVEPIEKFEINRIELLSQESKNYYNQLQEKFVNNLLKYEYTNLIKLSQQLCLYLNTFNYTQLSQSPKKLLNKSLLKDNLIVEILKLKSIINKFACDIELYQKKDFKQLIRQNKDFTIILRNAHQSYYILNMARKIILEIEYIIKKYIRKDQNQNSATFQVEEIIESSTSISNVSVSRIRYKDLPENLINIQKFTEKYKQLCWSFQKFDILNYTPIFKNQPTSFIGYALNSKTFNDILSENNNKKQIKVKINLQSSFNFENTIKDEIQIIGQNLKIELPKKDYKDDIYQVTIFNHKEFEQIRNTEGIDLHTFIKSIVGCSSWDNSGGKSNSSFFKSQNDLIVMKIINDKQFIQFRKFVSYYIQYVNLAKNTTAHKSLLAKIFGIFQVNIRGTLYNCIAMQNIFFKLDLKPQIIYDLKGSETNRFAPYINGKSFTGLDTNFKIDRNGQPICLKPSLYNQIIETLSNDTKFLSDQEVIDYSLLLIINLQKYELRMGIIDFMRPYHIIQKLQSKYKQIKYNSTPTVIPPKQYSNRFMAAMRKYFMKISE